MIEEHKKKYKLPSWQLALLESPVESYKTEKQTILVQEANGEAKDLLSISPIVNAVADKKENGFILVIGRSAEKHTKSLLKTLKDKDLLISKSAA